MKKATLSNSEKVNAGCRRGDRWAQRALFERHYEKIYRVLYSSPAAADVLVAAFLHNDG